MAATLFITTPNGQHQCAGQYELLANESANSHPVWKQSSGTFWLYSGNNGMWIVGGKDAKDKNFDCAHGMLFCRTLHGGVTPDKVSGVWERLNGDKFVEDSSIVVSTTFYKPFALRVVTPNGQQRCAGEYVVVADEMANGLPLWRQKAGKCWLYCGINGSWIIGGSDAKEKDFKCSRGVLYSKRASGGIMPDKVGGVWMRLSGSEFNEDAAITVALKPSPLYVQSPNGQQRCAGEYNPVPDKMANGYPLWQHVAARCWLYSGSNGLWIIGGTDAQAKNFQCTRGVIYCKTAHAGEPPDKMVSNWMRLDGDTFREDAAISVSSKPSVLYVISPNGQQKSAGEYVLLASESVHGHPVWKQRKGNMRLCSSEDGNWVVLNVNPKDGNPATSSTVVLRSQIPHNGLLPDKVGGEWARIESEEVIRDDEIKVVTFLNKPAKLHVVTPKGQQKCGGEYVLVAGETANSQPLWRQMGGKYWLYSGTNGMWIVGSNGAKQKNFDCSRGVIYSATPHGGVMPDKVGGIWLRLDGEQFIEDPDIGVKI